MKKALSILIGILFLNVSVTTAQVQQVDLEQTKGVFTTEALTLTPGEYQFSVANTNVGHEVGFVLVPSGSYEMTDHIKEAYVEAPVPTGKKSMTGVVDLAPGEYEYFCPLNPTPKYKLTVVDGVETIKLGQVPGTFKVKALTVAEGPYQFEIANNGVDHEVGFVLVKKGQYEMTDHIKAAYVKAPVAEGSSSMTGIVNLTKGEYEYFCPLNPTDKFSLSVE